VTFVTHIYLKLGGFVWFCHTNKRDGRKSLRASLPSAPGYVWRCRHLFTGPSDISALDAFPSGEISLGNDDQAGSRCIIL